MRSSLLRLKTWGKSPLHHLNLAEKSVNWIYDPEEKDQFYYHIGKKQTKSTMTSLGWTAENVIYSLNTQSYRSDSFENYKNIKVITAGCSQTFGIGINEQSLWTKKLCNWLDCSHVNLGIPGTDWTAIGKRLSWWIPELKPEIVCIYAPPTHRFSWWAISQDTEYSTTNYSEEELLKATINNRHVDPGLAPVKYPLLIDILDDINVDYYRNSSMEYILSLCKYFNSELFVITRDEHTELGLRIEGDLARDLSHHGRKTHKNIYERFKEKIDNKETFSSRKNWNNSKFAKR
jgi:hypothetical protein